MLVTTEKPNHQAGWLNKPKTKEDQKTEKKEQHQQ
jgi:hypothetical protein